MSEVDELFGGHFGRGGIVESTARHARDEY